MAISVIIDSVTYSIPELGERNWGQNTTDLLEALGNAAYLIKGGNIPLDAEAVFTTYGLRAPWFASTGANASSTGAVRLANLDAVNWRNAADSADLTLTVDGSDKLTFDGSEVLDADNTVAVTNKSIDADSNTITNIDNADIKAGAAIDAAKIHDGSVSNTEFGYLDGVTSAIQTQIDTDAANLTSHTSDATIHFTEASIDHTAIQNIGTNTHAQIDAHIAGTNVHGVNEVMGTSGSTLQTIDILTTNKINDADDFELQPTTILTRLTSFTTDRAMASIDPANTEWLILANDTSYTLTIKNEDTGATAANRILTGTGADVDIAAGASVHLAYDSTESRWRVIGSNLQESAIDHTAIQNIGTNTHAQIDTHIAASSAHGVSGDIVGTTDTQTLTNKTIDADLSTITNIGTSELTDLGVTTAKLAASSVTGAKIEDNVALPGTEAVGIPSGTTAQRAVSPTNGDLRYNSTTSKFEGYQGGAWGDIGGEGGAAGKNYILNPDAAADTSDVTGDSGFSVARTTTAAQLAEESKGTGYLISGSGLTAGTSKVAWAITATGIDDADGGFFGKAVCKVLDVSGSINGQYSIQVYNVTDSVYVGDSDTITGTGTYVLSVPLVAGNDYEFHLIAETAAPSNIGISGVTIEPVSQTTAGVTGKWQSYSETVVGLGSATTRLQWRINGQNVELVGDITAGTIDVATELQIPLPNSYTVSLLSSTSTITVGQHQRDSTNAQTNGPVLATDGDTFLNFGEFDNTTNANTLSPADSDQMYANNNRLSFFASVPVAELANAHTPTASDVQYENVRLSYTKNDAQAHSNSLATTIIYDDVVVNNSVGQYNPSTGEYTASIDHQVQLSAGLGFTNTNTTMAVKIDGTVIKRSTTTGSNQAQINGLFDLAAGEVLTTHATDGVNNSTNSTNTIYNWLDITKVADYSARKASLPFPNGTVRLNTGNGHGSTNTKIRRFTNSTVTGDAFTYADSSTDGMSITVNRDMVASFSYTDRNTVGTEFIGFSVNSAQLTTDIYSITTANRLIQAKGESGSDQTVSVTIKLNKGDIVRAHTDGTPNAVDARTQFVAQELYPLGN